MVSIRDIPYSSLPNQSNLFLKYLELSPDVLRFYQYAPIFENISTELRDKVMARHFRRPEITSILRRQNERYGCTPETLNRIKELEKPDCVAILTGQQVGLFTGPLYTIYKALTAIQLSDELGKQGIPAVPIFWMETEDHDLAEVTRQTVLTEDNTARTIDYRDILFETTPSSSRPVGSIHFPDAIREVVRDFSGFLPDSEWKSKVLSLLESACQPGFTFALSFARVLHKILPGSGLILFDPQDPEAKSYVSEVFRWALEKSDDIHASLVERNRQLKAAGFHSQVYIPDHSTTLFYIEDGERRLLERRNRRFGLKNSDRRYSLKELQDCLESHPEKFSPNVLLRPIIQDILFPTLAYVAGPSELAYFAQAEVLYTSRRIPMPVIWPRESFTLMVAGIRKTMHRLGIEIKDCFDGIQLLRERVLQNHKPRQTDASLRKLEERMEKTLSEISRKVVTVDPSLPGAIDTAYRKIKHNIERMNSRLLHIEGTRNSSLLNASGLLLNHCLPNRNLQERELSPHYYLSLLGPSILDSIRTGIRMSGFSHHVLQLD